MSRKKGLRVLTLAAAILAAGFPAAAQAPQLAMLDTIDRGAWTLRLRGNGGEQRICVRNGRELIQIQHNQRGCDRFVVEDAAAQVTVQYTCRGDGYGRTTIRKEGNRLVQIRSQGIQGGAPFSVEGEARYAGGC